MKHRSCFMNNSSNNCNLSPNSCSSLGEQWPLLRTTAVVLSNNYSSLVEEFDENSQLFRRTITIVWTSNCNCFIEHRQSLYWTTVIVSWNNCSCFIEQFLKQLQLLYRTIQRKFAVVSSKNCNCFIEQFLEQPQLLQRTTAVVPLHNWRHNYCFCTEQLQSGHSNSSTNNCSKFALTTAVV